MLSENLNKNQVVHPMSKPRSYPCRVCGAAITRAGSLCWSCRLSQRSRAWIRVAVGALQIVGVMLVIYLLYVAFMAAEGYR